MQGKRREAEAKSNKVKVKMEWSEMDESVRVESDARELRSRLEMLEKPSLTVTRAR